MVKAIIRMIGWLFASTMGDNLIRFVAGKAILSTLFIVVIPLLLNNFMYDLIEVSMGFLNQNANASGVSGAMSFSGLAAYFIYLLKVPECMSVLVSAIVLRVSLNHVPFLRV